MKHIILKISIFTLGTMTAFCQSPDSLIRPRMTFRKEQHDSLMTQHKAIREKALDDLKESIFRFRIDMGALDTVLQNLPIPHDIEISDEAIRIEFNGKDDKWDKLDTSLQKKERQDIVKFGEDVIINSDEQINGDVVVIGGNVKIMGEVHGGVVVIFGNAYLKATSVIKEDIVCIWGDTEIDKEAQIDGMTTVLQLGKSLTSNIEPSIFSSFILAFRFLRFILLFLFLILIYLAFPKSVETIRNQISSDYAKSLIVGIIGLILLPVMFIILLITILGIPIAVLILPLVILVSFLMGGAGFSLLLGQWTQDHMGLKLNSTLLHLVIGMIILEFFPFLRKVFELINPAFSFIFLAITILIFLLAWIPGFGAVLLTRFGTVTPSQNKK